MYTRGVTDGGRNKKGAVCIECVDFLTKRNYNTTHKNSYC